MLDLVYTTQFKIEIIGEAVKNISTEIIIKYQRSYMEKKSG